MPPNPQHNRLEVPSHFQGAFRKRQKSCFVGMRLVKGLSFKELSSALNGHRRATAAVPPPSHTHWLVNSVLEAPCVGGLTGALPHIGSSACQAEGSKKLWALGMLNS